MVTSSYLPGKGKRKETTREGRTKSQYFRCTALPLEFTDMLWKLMLSATEHTEGIHRKWSVRKNLLCVFNSAERHFKSASFVFLRIDHDCVYWQWILKSLISNTRGLITQLSEGNLEVKIITPISKRQTGLKHYTYFGKINSLSLVFVFWLKANCMLLGIVRIFLDFFWTQ